MDPELELLLDAQAQLGEGPCWYAASQQLYWVDILQKQLHIYRPADNDTRAIQLDFMIGTVAARQAGGVIVALENGFATLDLDTEALTFLVDPESDKPQNRFNDGKCDPAGRFLAGTMALNERDASGAVYCLDEVQQVRRLFGEVTVSNGIGWSPDYQTMYYIDSPTREVVAFDYDLRSGGLNNRRVVITVPSDMGFPDGMTTDQEGTLWIAMWGGESLTRWNPATGELLQRIPVPAANITACTFGGPALQDLYITTARVNTKAAMLEKYPHAGGLFRLKTEVEGMPNFEYAG